MYTKRFCPDFSIIYHVTLSHAAQQTIASLEHLALSNFIFVFWSSFHESAFNYKFLAGNMYRACLFGVQISDISNQEKRKRLQTGKETQ